MRAAENTAIYYAGREKNLGQNATRKKTWFSLRVILRMTHLRLLNSHEVSDLTQNKPVLVRPIIGRTQSRLVLVRPIIGETQSKPA